MSGISSHAQAAYDMQCALYRRWVRGDRGPQIPPFDTLAVPFPDDRTRIEHEEMQRALYQGYVDGTHPSPTQPPIPRPDGEISPR